MVAIQPIVLSKSKLTITKADGSGGGDYEDHVAAATFTPSSTTVSRKGLGGNSFTGVGRATWVLDLDVTQDHETAESLSNFLYDNEAEKLHVVLEPEDGGQGWEADIYAVPTAIGGAVDTVAAGTVSCPVDGRPERAAAA